MTTAPQVGAERSRAQQKPNRWQAVRHDFAWLLLGFAALGANLRFDAGV